MITLKDWQGTEYMKGSRIVYVNGDSSGNIWRPGVIEEIVEVEKWGRPSYEILWRDETTHKVGRLSNLSRIMVLETYPTVEII